MAGCHNGEEVAAAHVRNSKRGRVLKTPTRKEQRQELLCECRTPLDSLSLSRRQPNLARNGGMSCSATERADEKGTVERGVGHSRSRSTSRWAKRRDPTCTLEVCMQIFKTAGWRDYLNYLPL
jgi:hypothetical protein